LQSSKYHRNEQKDVEEGASTAAAAGCAKKRLTVGAREEKERGLAAKLRRSQAQAGSEGLPRDDDTGGYEEDDVAEGEGE
jgi:hypothetical protein